MSLITLKAVDDDADPRLVCTGKQVVAAEVWDVQIPELPGHMCGNCDRLTGATERGYVGADR